MNEIYKPPEAELRIRSSESTHTLNWTLFFVVSFLCYLGVSHISPLVNNLYVHLLFDKDTGEYWDFRLISDLLQSTLYLGIGGYALGRSFGVKWWFVCAILSLIFILNSFRIIGFEHIITGTCERHWYDVLIILKTPIAFILGGYVGSSHKSIIQNQTRTSN